MSACEISIKKALGKLAAPDDLAHHIQAGGFSRLPITIAHGVAAGQLVRRHDDPFDRMLIAQALAEGLTKAARAAREWPEYRPGYYAAFVRAPAANNLEVVCHSR